MVLAFRHGNPFRSLGIPVTRTGTERKPVVSEGYNTRMSLSAVRCLSAGAVDAIMTTSPSGMTA